MNYPAASRPGLRGRFAEPAMQGGSSDKLLCAIEALFSAVNFQSEEETIRPENVEIAKRAFRGFLNDLGLVLSEKTFADILEENSGENAFRGDGKVPNWYHFFRQVLPKLNAVRNGLISEETLNRYGGLDVLIAATLYHDSWEDHLRDPFKIFKDYQTMVHGLHADKKISSKKLAQLQAQATEISTIVDYCTRKHDVLDPVTGKAKRDENGRKIVVVRFNGDLNSYYNEHRKHPFALWIKWDDADEGVSTRIFKDTLERDPELKFSVASNADYADKIRRFYGRRDTRNKAASMWPDFKEVFGGVDSRLGVNLVLLEIVNDYAQDPNMNPDHADPASLMRYETEAYLYSNGIPMGWLQIV